MAMYVVVIGGSLAGLLHGVMLTRHGYSVTILEQDPSPAREGFDAGIMVKEEVLEFLQKHDRMKRELYVPAEGPQFNLNQDGRPKFSFVKPASLTSWGLLMSTLRANFDGRVSKAIPVTPLSDKEPDRAKFINGASVTDIKDLGEKVQVQYEDAKTESTEILLADFVIVGSGSKASIRSIFLPEAERQYAGYIAWRGTVREDFIEEHHKQVFLNKLTFSSVGKGFGYFVVYVIPTDDGDLTPGNRLINWVWYTPLLRDSEKLSNAMTDINGTRHLGTVPRGLVHPNVWERQQALASSVCPPCISALLNSTQRPFVTMVEDVVKPPSQAVFYGNKVFMVGDALNAPRPNIGVSTSQAAYQCLQLEKVIRGTISAKEWEKRVLRYSNAKRLFGVLYAELWIGSWAGFIWVLCKYIMFFVRQRFGFTG
ncbi:hypothetical protein BDV96DRAFT_568167 [Lophiotrema nucula]|uniref:Uncharacterized protein n=1 Tax=Lophiotrema nucula TaxID=690887 RepID=A0A6A5ZK64_9PLEO|nr:hypothetical protein BDV96DRAFT_568167 [Lophiotrema nucula]